MIETAEADALFRVERRHVDVHARLEAWARWVKSGRRMGGGVAPMFRLHRSSYARGAPPEPHIAHDELAALAVERAVSALEEAPREVVRWSYVLPYQAPGRVLRYLQMRHAGLRMGDLPALLAEGREAVRIALRS